MARDTFTARAARWSATHRKTAVLGWLAFVVVAFMIGGAVGTVTLKHEDMGNGDSRAAERVLAQQFPRERAAEQVLIQSRNGGLLRQRVPRRRRRARRAPVAHAGRGADRVAAAARQRGSALQGRDRRAA